MSRPGGGPYLLVATVGGSPAPIVASLLYWEPIRAYFVVSEETHTQVEDEILPALRAAEGWVLNMGCYETFRIADSQDYAGTFNELLGLAVNIAEWRASHPKLSVVCDFTGGTKAMSAALGLIAARWECSISYVGGTKRTKGGIGTVVPGKEQVVHRQNPWNALGVLALDQALLLLQRHAFASAHSLLQSTIKHVDDDARKKELNAVAQLADALTDWDRFQHGAALKKLRRISGYENDLEAGLGHEKAVHILRAVRRLCEHCASAVEDGRPGLNRTLVLDLIANAQRRIDEGRWDDATGRLYRAIEAIAQLRLRSRGYDNTGAVPLEELRKLGNLPAGMLLNLEAAARDGKVEIALKDAWRLLGALNDEAAEEFEKEFGDFKKSQLRVRNESILAHGFTPVPCAVPKHLRDVALRLLPAKESELPVFKWPVET